MNQTDKFKKMLKGHKEMLKDIDHHPKIVKQEIDKIIKGLEDKLKKIGRLEFKKKTYLKFILGKYKRVSRNIGVARLKEAKIDMKLIIKIYDDQLKRL